MYWLVLNKKGNSSQRERIALLNRFVGQFGSGCIQGILGDREFIGEAWWGWMKARDIPFIMRMKANQHYREKQQSRAVGSLFRSLRVGESTILRKPRYVSGQLVWLSALRLQDANSMSYAFCRVQRSQIYRPIEDL